MRIIISPAKKMNVDRDSLSCSALPAFVDRAEELRDCLQAMSDEELKALWNCSDRIAEQNVRRLERMDLRHGLTPAILAYEGIQYQYMAPGVFSREELDYVQITFASFRASTVSCGLLTALRPIAWRCRPG